MVMPAETKKPTSPHLAAGCKRAFFDAVIFDLDGVITQTAKLHAAAWTDLFDEFFRRRASTTGQILPPFNADTDYRRHIDGKPRLAGLQDFLQSLGIELTQGGPQTPPGQDSLYGLSQRKNQLYLERLSHGVPVYSSSVNLIRNLRAMGIKTAVTSSSRNCAAVLAAAGLVDLFDVRVDGVEAERIGLAGKPAPDTFLHAASQMGVSPARCVVVEDAVVGVQAGRRGGFGLVVGVDRNRQSQALVEAGADWVVADLAEVGEASTLVCALRRSDALPSALQAFADIKARLNGRRLALFLDYDGTLTPIVQRPELAVLSEEMRSVLRALPPIATVVVVSGRDLPDVREKVGLDGIVYGGSHGFEILGPQGDHISQQKGMEFLPLLDQAEQALQQRLDAIPGLLVERKKYSIAIHFRLVAPADLETVESAVDEVLAAHQGLRKTRGKMIYELQPDIPWDKGQAMRWLLETLRLTPTDTLVLYLGDDRTDEDAFRALHSSGHGLGILVRDVPRATSADYALDSTAEVQRFLTLLLKLAAKGRA